MRSLSMRSLLFSTVLLISVSAFAHDITLTGAQTFASLDGSSADHDGVANGVFSVSDGNLVVNGVVNCNDDTSTSACPMAFAVSGNMTINSGGALYAENRSGSGTGGAITLTVGGNLALNGTAIVSTASGTSSGSTGGAITANVTGTVTLASGSTIDSGATNAAGGSISVNAGGAITVNGNVLSGPSRTILSTKLTGVALNGGTANQIGGAITIGSTTFSEPAVLIGATANIISQGDNNGAGPVTINGCGIQVRGLVAALARKDSAAKVIIRSGKDLLIDSRDLGGSGTRMGRVRADAPTGSGANKGVDLFARETIDIFGLPGGALYTVTSIPGLHDSKSFGGLIRIVSLEDAVNASGNVIDDGHTASGDTGGTVEISAKGNVGLNTAVIRAEGDFNTGNNNRGGGTISIRSHSGNIVWTNGIGDVRPVGSSSGLAPADQGKIFLTACGTVDTTGTSFPANGTPTGVFPVITTGSCSPAAPSLPAGVTALITCNTPPVANDASATTNEDTTVTITLSGTDADGDPLTFSIVSGPSNGSLSAITPTGPNTATVDYTPNLNYFGGDSFVYQANDGNGGTDNATVTITVNPVNDPPSFLAGPTVTVLEDSGAQTYTNWATSISPGPANESGQTVTFTVTNDNNALFSVQPALSSSGTLTFTPAAHAFGTATITIVAQDNGGIANGGNDTSASQSSSITVTPVNDEPSFVKGADQTVNEDAGAQTVPGWATSISAGPNESGQTLTFVTSNDNNALFSAQPAVSPSGTLTYTPAGNAFGSATVSVYLTDNGGIANGGDDTSPTQTFTITVNPVNDEPSFTGGGDVTVLEDSGAYSAAWATGISTGPANESSQTVTFNVLSNSNASLFASGPSISSTGVLSFTPASNAFGSATIVINLTDNGGITNGGDDTSASYTFTITVTPVNDAPSFTPGGDVTVNEDSGPYSAPWATGISPGPNESGQTVTFNVSNNNNALFLVQPSINSAGVLSFTPALNAFGSATVTVSLQDNGGIANGGVDTSASVQFTITVNAVNDGPTAGNDSWETLGNTELRVDFAGGLTPKISDTTTSGNGVRDNDSDSEGDPTVVTGIVGCSDVVAPFDCTLGDGSKVSMLANGSFSYTPGPGNTTGSFQYTLTDIPAFGAPASSIGTVTITIHDMIWYVNGSAAAGGNGTSIAPFNSFATLNGAGDVDDPGDTIFVHTSAVNGSIALEANQKFWGEGVGLATNLNLNGNGSPQVLVAPGVKPSILSGSDTVTVTGVTGVDIAGVALTSSTGNGIDVTSALAGPAAGATIHDNTILGAAQEGIDVNADSAAGTTVLVSNTSITSDGNGFDVASGGPAVVSYTDGTIQSNGGTGIRMDGSVSGNLTVTGLANVTITGFTAGGGISITAAKFDSVPGGAFNAVNAGTVTVGALGNPVGSAGVTLSNVSGDLAFGTLTVFGGTSGVTIGGSGLFTGAAGMRVTSGGGSISAPAGVGLSVTNATIGAANLNFTSISSTGGVNGILLSNTDSAGGLTVSGSGSAASGGTILGSSGDGVSLTSTQKLSLSWMSIANNLGSGIRGTTVNGFVVNNSSITGNGDNAATDESGINVTGLTGTVIGGAYPTAINNTTVSNNYEFEIQITGSTGTVADFQMNNDIVASNGASGFHGNLVNFLASGTANMTLNVNGGSFTGNAPSTATAIHADASGGSVTANITGATMINNNVGVNVSTALSGSLVFDVHDNPLITGNRSHGLNLFVGANTTGTVSGKFRNNLIGTLGVVGSGSQLGFGVRVQNEALANTTVLISGNTIQELLSFAAINVNHGIIGSPLTGTTAVTILNNVIRNVNDSRAIIVQQNNVLGANSAGTTCVDISGNDMSGVAGNVGDGSKIRLRRLAGATFNVRQKAATAAVDPLELDDANSVGANVTTAAQVSVSGTFNFNAGTCAQP